MRLDFKDLDDAALAACIEENGFAFLRPLGTLPGAEVYEDAHVLRLITRLYSSTFNAVLRAGFAPAEIEDRVAGTLAAFGTPRLPLTWWIGPATRTPGLSEVLLARGLVHAVDAPGMAIDLRALAAAPASPLPTHGAITPVADAQGIERWVQAFAACYQFDEQTRQIWLTVHRHLALSHPDEYHYYVGWVGGVPVATSLVFLHEGVAGIYQVATVPEQRGQGIGAAMTTVALREALGRGYSIGVLESSLMAAPLYRRLGFRQHCTLSAYVWSPQ